MGMDFNAGKLSNLCNECNRADYDEHFYAGNRLFKKHDTVSINPENGCLVYKGVPKLFGEHIENQEYYHGQEAIKKWESVKDCIDEEAYAEVNKLLEGGDGYIYAWW